ncbi:ATP-dependent DNA helicase PIF1-like [Camellia sinensis]|uniref:ATP-dependent DNA helicase PIF1-like n=1 Tax=Camellia sinensis TaxID=4442 RepID=UPI0010369A06|nr:ATP-dependent DNA helicase PIF1-like [Camellia sinensis]
MLNIIYPYVSIFRTARDMICENGAQELHICILSSRDGRQYTRPTTTEIAALIVGDGSESTRNRDVIVTKLDGHLQRINETHPSYMPLQYPLLFPYGTNGWRRWPTKYDSALPRCDRNMSKGIATLLLPGKQTAYSRFKIPLDPDNSSCCSINQGTDVARLIQEASLIIWDEAPMVSHHAFEAVDYTFRDILKNTKHCSEDKVFGGKLFVLGGDFRQILFVVPRGGREQTVEASLPKSTIWKHCQVLHLTRNMRVIAQDISNHTRHELRDFAEWIKLVGEGKIMGSSFSEGYEPNWIQIPEKFVIKNGERDLHQLIDATYPDFINKYQDMSYLKERGILAPKNSDVDEINSIMLSMLPGEMKTFNSADKLCPTESESNVQDMNPPELLHSLNLPGLPNHCLQLKVGTPIMLLRNVNQSLGLCNGTRLIVDKMGNRVIEARVITESRVGEKVLLSRIVLTPFKSHAPFTMKRRQFPIKLAFAMTISKSQGQTLKNVGLYLPNLVFSHGQLYVTLSCVTSPLGLKVLIINKQGIPDDVTKNVVYIEVFSGIDQ